MSTETIGSVEGTKTTVAAIRDLAGAHGLMLIEHRPEHCQIVLLDESKVNVWPTQGTWRAPEDTPRTFRRPFDAQALRIYLRESIAKTEEDEDVLDAEDEFRYRLEDQWFGDDDDADRIDGLRIEGVTIRDEESPKLADKPPLPHASMPYAVRVLKNEYWRMWESDEHQRDYRDDMLRDIGAALARLGYGP